MRSPQPPSALSYTAPIPYSPYSLFLSFMREFGPPLHAIGCELSELSPNKKPPGGESSAQVGALAAAAFGAGVQTWQTKASFLKS